MDRVVVVNGWSDGESNIRVQRGDLVGADGRVRVRSFERVFERHGWGLHRVFVFVEQRQFVLAERAVIRVWGGV